MPFSMVLSAVRTNNKKQKTKVAAEAPLVRSN